jgi:hypothetical protein
MTWKLSRFRAGDLVEVRSREEILAGLDERGCLDGMPFMPEMLEFCGRQFRVRAVAHKTCDTAKQTWSGRRLDATVHLAGTFCDGSAHGGCEAECTLFWKDAWLKSADERQSGLARPAAASGRACTEADLRASTRDPGDESQAARYRCQATQLYDFTAPLAAWDPRQYLYDVWTGNHSVSHVLRVVLLAWLRWMLPRIPLGYRPFRAFHDWAHLRLSGRPCPTLTTHVEDGERTPAGRLDLMPGEWVRIKPQSQIEPTLDKARKNRGLTFDHQEMAPYCNRVVRVRKAVTRIIDEPSGRMIEMKQPCIMLEGVVCKAEYANRRLNCPREIASYWRELWLERVEEPARASTGSHLDDSKQTPAAPER